MSYPKPRKTLWIVQGKDRHGLDFFVVATTKHDARSECVYENARGGNLRIDKYIPAPLREVGSATQEGGEDRG